MNVLAIKKLVDEIIDLLTILIEESGMDGDTEFANSLELDQNVFVKNREELSDLQNSYVMAGVLITAIKKHVPSFNTKLFKYYAELVVSRKENTIKQLTSENTETNYIISLADHANTSTDRFPK